MSEPVAVGCSWLDDREFMGRGRSHVHINFDSSSYGDSIARVANSFQNFTMTMERMAQVSRETNERMRQVAKAFDVPPEILGLDGDGA